MSHWFGGPDGSHEHADTVHESRDCHHLRNADRIYAISYVPDESVICGTCGSPGNDSGSGGDDSDDDSGADDAEDRAEQ